MKEIKEEKEWLLASSMMILMSHILNMEYQEGEVAYLTMHLCGKNSQQTSQLYIDQEIYNVVNEFLKVIEKKFGDFIEYRFESTSVLITSYDSFIKKNPISNVYG